MQLSGSTLDRGGADDGEITYAALVKAVREGAAALVDVREPHEFHAGHVEGSTLLPMSAFDPGKLPRDKPVVLICRSGNRSLMALFRARAAGVTDICHYRGGVIGWAREGGELV
jgi:rhodanese-related sulfurtransferase